MGDRVPWGPEGKWALLIAVCLGAVIYGGHLGVSHLTKPPVDPRDQQVDRVVGPQQKAAANELNSDK